MRRQCAQCKQHHALTFDRCPACGAPAGGPATRPPRPASATTKPGRDSTQRDTAGGTPAATAPRGAGVDARPEPATARGDLEAPTAAPSRVEREGGAPPPVAAIPDLDLAGLTPKRPAPPLELGARDERPDTSPEPRLQRDAAPLETPDSGPGARPPGEPPPAHGLEPDAPARADASPLSGADAWEAAARAQRAEVPAPTPVARPAFKVIVMPRHETPPAVQLGRYLRLVGVACVLLAFTPVGCWRAWHSFEKVEVGGLATVKSGARVEVTDGVADWNGAVDVDPSQPIALSDACEVRRRARELMGKMVEVEARAFGEYLYRVYRTRPDTLPVPGKTPEMARVYLALTPDSSVRAVSRPVSGDSFEASDVKGETARTEHVGVVQKLAHVVSLDLIRKAEPGPGGHLPFSQGKARVTVPDDAVAIVHGDTLDRGQKLTVAPIVATQGRYAAVTMDPALKPSAEESLFGTFFPRPGRECEQFTWPLFQRPEAVLVLTRGEKFPWKLHVALGVLPGIGLAVGATSWCAGTPEPASDGTAFAALRPRG